MDIERAEAEIANCADKLWCYLRALENESRKADRERQRRLAKTASIFTARTVGLAKQARRVMASYPRVV